MTQHQNPANLLQALISTSVLLMLVAMMSACSENTDTGADNVTDILKRANSYFDQGQYRAASIEAENAMRAAPNDIRPKLLVNTLLLHLDQSKTALQHLESLNATDNPEFIHLLLQAYNKRNKYHSTLEAAEKYFDTVKGTDYEFGVIISQAIAFIAVADHASAIDSFKRAEKFAKKPDQIASIAIEKAKLLLIQKDERSAIALLDELLKSGSNAEALLIKGVISFKKGQLEETEALLTDALITLKTTDIITPLRAKVLNALVATLTKRGRSTEALVYSQILAEAAPNLEENKVKFKDAIQLFKDGDFASAEVLFNEVDSDTSGNDMSARMLGVISARKGNFDEAKKFLENSVDPETAPLIAIQLLSETYLKLNQPEKAVALLEKRVKVSPTDAKILTMYGISLLAVDQEKDAIKHINKAMMSDPNEPASYKALTAIYNKTDRPEKALAILEKAHSSNNKNTDIQKILIQQLLLTKKTQRAKTLTSDLVNRHSNNSEVHTFAASVSLQTEDLASAKSLFSKAVKLDNKDVIPLLGIAQVEMIQGKFQQAKSLFNQIIAIEPNNTVAYKGLVAVYSELGNKGAIKSVLTNAALSPDVWAPLSVLAEHSLATNELSAARESIEESLLRDPNQKYTTSTAAKVYYLIASQKFKDGDYSSARETLLESFKFAPNNIASLTLLVNIEINTDNLAEATKLIAKIEGASPNATVIPLLKGEVAEHKNDTNAAIKIYKDAWASNPTQPLAEKTYTALKATLPTEAATFLSEWQQTFPKDWRAYLLEGIAAQGSANPEKSITAYEKALAINDKSDVALNNLAWLYHQKKDKRTLATAEKAYSLSPNNADIADTYGWLLTLNGDVNKGVTILEKASHLAPQSTEIKEHFDAAKRKKDISNK